MILRVDGRRLGRVFTGGSSSCGKTTLGVDGTRFGTLLSGDELVGVTGLDPLVGEPVVGVVGRFLFLSIHGFSLGTIGVVY